MIPEQNSTSIPEVGSIIFHVVMDDFNRVFCMEGPNSNGVRDFDFCAQSQDDAVEQIRSYYPGYNFLGECLSVWDEAN